MIVDVIAEIKTQRGGGIFTYYVPEELKNLIEDGSIVKIPFGNKIIRGVVISKKNNFKKINYKLKSILTVKQDFKINNNYINIAKWISNYYLCSLGEAISIFLPPDINRPRKQITDQNQIFLPKKINPLTTDQKEIFRKLEKSLSSENKKPALLFGVTGSGKTEIYLHLARKTLELNKAVVLLVPEIVLTPQNITRFKEIFGPEVVLTHSGLSKSEKFHCYQSFYSGQKKIIIGPRSAILIPNENIGLIIVDEEQEDSYKQEQNPRYEAGELAVKISEKLNALVVFGTATPKIETFYKANKGIFDFYKIKNRFNSLMLPTAEIIDLRNEMKKENFSPISERLYDSILETLKNKEQAILFLNRRGMSTFVSCRDCGFVASCSECDLPMVYHLNNYNNNLVCHHCQKKVIVPKNCPICKSSKIKYFGSGIEKIELEIKKLFPKARVKMVDSKILQNHTQYENFYKDFRDHKFDIVIGTQILAKGFDIPGVSLVGIISADVGLHLPYFRSSEKIFRLITQVSGRSGRKHKTGKTIIQTYWPNSPAIQYASKHDFESFYHGEILRRLEKNYPPKNHIIRILSEHKNQNTAKSAIDKLSNELTKNNINFIGPGVCFFQRLNNKFRYQIILKIEKLPNKIITEIFHNYQNLTWDVDAINLL